MIDSKSTLEAVTAIAVLGNAVLTWWTSRKIERTNAKIALVAEEATKIRKIVDGPLTIALDSNKELSAHVADLTGDHGDALVAFKAAAIAENRQAGKEATPLPTGKDPIANPTPTVIP